MAKALEQVLSRNIDQETLLAPNRRPLDRASLEGLIEARSRELQEVGISSTTLVAMCLPKSIETAEVFLVLSTHFCCMPLNPAATESELTQLLARTPAQSIVTTKGSVAEKTARKIGLHCLLVTPLVEGGFKWVTPPHFNTQTLSDTPLETGSVLLATSGSTAEPKLVLLSSEALVKSALNMIETVSLTSDDRCLNMMPLFHVGGLVDLLIAPLISGGSVIITEAINTRTFFQCLDSYHPSWYQGVPAMLRDITMAEQLAGNKHANQLRFIRAVSAALPATLALEVRRVFGCPVVHIYGMTETAGVITSHRLSAPHHLHLNSVGTSAGPEVQIRRPDQRWAAPNEEGEICVRGNTVIHTYYPNTGDNSDPTDAGLGWFPTGDLGHLSDDGYLYLSGRIKDIINRGGEKISPLEIDHCLLDYPGIKEAAAFGVTHSSLGEEVAVAVVPLPNTKLESEAIIQWLRPRLASHKIPRKIHFTDALPVGSSGKMLRRALSEHYDNPDSNTPSNSAAEVAGTPDEKALIAIWKSLLGAPHIGMDDNFFDLGGDSLAAANFSIEFSELTGVELPMSALHEHPTPRRMTQFLNALPQNPELAQYYRSYLPDSGLPALVYKELSQVMNGWAGSRHHPQALIVGKQLEGSKPPLFWVTQDHDHLSEMLHHLGPDQPIYCMRSLLNLPCRSPQHSRALAQHFAEEIAEIQPNGPYLIGGYCAGGDLAVNISYELRLRGAQVPLMILVDTNSNTEYPYDGDVLLFYTRTSRTAPKRCYLNPSLGWNRAYVGRLYSQAIDVRHGQTFSAKKSKHIMNAMKEALENYNSHSLQWRPSSPALTRHTADTYAAQIHSKVPTYLSLGRPITIPVRVRNRSAKKWEPTCKSGLIVGACFNKKENNRRQVLAGYQELTHAVLPGASLLINLTIHVPFRIKNMTLQIDMIDDGVDWFSRRGSTPFETAVRIRPFSQLLQHLINKKTASKD